MELTLKNLSSQQVITILSELVPDTELNKIVKLRLRNSQMPDEEIIGLLMKAAEKHTG